MDKYEFNLKIEQLKKLINEEDYLTALKIVESIDWNRVRNTNLLTTAANVYERNDLLQEAKDMLILAFERAPVGKHILFKLTELSCRTGDLEEAEDYYREFRAADSTDIGNYTLQYMILKARHAPYERQLLPLERYCEIDPDEKWLYELATVYEYANRTDDCVRVCDRLALLYGGSGYGLKALRLKSRYAALTDAQRNILYPRSVPVSGEGRNSEYADGSMQYAGGSEYGSAVNNAAANEAVGNVLSGQNDAEYASNKGYSAGASSVQNAAYSADRADAKQDMRQTGVYDDRDYNADAKRITIPVYTEEAEPVQDNAELDARMSDALAAERYAGEDEAFNAYVRVCASDEGRPTAARVEVVNGTASVQSQPQPAEDEGVQLSFDFGGAVPKVVDEPYVPAERETVAQTEAANAAVTGTAAAMGANAAFVSMAQTAANTTGSMTQAAQTAAAMTQTQFVQSATQPVTAAQNMGAVSTSQPSHEPQPAQSQLSQQSQSVQPSQPSAAEKLSQEAAGSPLGQGLTQQQTQRPLVPHQQLKSATPVRGLHMIVEAATAADGLGIAIDELKNIHEEKGIEHASVKTSADKLNKNGINEAIISKVSGKDFVIEHAGALSAENISTIYRFICSDKTGTIVVLIDTPDGLDRIEELEPKLFDICDYISDIDDDEETAAKPELRVENGVTSRQTHPGADVQGGAAEEAPYDDAEDDDEPYDESADAAYDEDKDSDTDAYSEADTAYSKTAASAQADRRMPDAPDISEDRTPAPVKRSNGKVTAERFNNVKEVSPRQAGQQMEIDDFAQYCVQYAASIDCSITGTSMLALYERIELMEENDIPLTKTNAEQLIEEAADRAEKPPIGRRISGLFKSKYDKNGLLILKEDDFIY